MLEPERFLVELTENFGAEVLPDGKVRTSRSQLEACAAKAKANVVFSHAKNFEKGIHVPTISVRRVEKKGKKTETEILFFAFEERGGAIFSDPGEWGRVPTQIFG
ncbi:MAG: hypothetical protein A3J27_13035 [Candidatus Tectomicrobia bacterium RIFCSPLOWO2_12_FULL_69_37]|nr:MAG: hypothetical protein A3I72_03680 [Candidatus Tectomicrobia bacterium RIFCSPLOWO2_02_FULL_70_19]OGL61421.1 MAG: hypothetical protein A3J27_13035 [Candidatus Tectomicrobia bacterium RIFCSPLOWO2_12_FULL_69_37]